MKYQPPIYQLFIIYHTGIIIVGAD